MSKTLSNERGIAMVMALFMVLVLSVVGSSLMFVSQTETWASTNYRLASQSRYAAESGLHVAANHLLYTYAAPATAADLAAYNLTTSPVTAGGNPVVLSSDPNVPSNYPDAAEASAFLAAATGSLAVTNGTALYTTVATLKSMRQITEPYSTIPTTIQSWDIVATGKVPGARASQVDVSATIEREVNPSFAYAAFATASGCEALSFAGGATTDSYDSNTPLVGGLPAVATHSGNVGTNGNLTGSGDPTTVHGTLSSPRSGVGNCTANNVTAQTISGSASVSGGLVELSQPVTYRTPDAPDPLPPTTSESFTQAGGCPGSVTDCAASTNGATITPPSATAKVTMGNVSLQGNAILHLNAGIYVINSLAMQGNARIVIDSGPVIFQVAGQSLGPSTPAIQIAGNGISNTSYDPTQLQFVYAGTGTVSLTGGAETSALVYAPNATGSFAGGSDFYGAVIVNRLTATGGTTIHYDRRLQTSAMSAGNFMMNAFSWKAY